MTVMAVAFQSITASALDRLTDNIKYPYQEQKHALHNYLHGIRE